MCILQAQSATTPLGSIQVATIASCFDQCVKTSRPGVNLSNVDLCKDLHHTVCPVLISNAQIHSVSCFAKCLHISRDEVLLFNVDLCKGLQPLIRAKANGNPLMLSISLTLLLKSSFHGKRFPSSPRNVRRVFDP